MSVRRLLPIHRWAALTLGLIALVSAFTGAGMAFRKQVEPIVYARSAPATCAAPLSLDELLAAARMVHPKGDIDYLRVQRAPRAPVAVRYLNKDTLYLDRCTQQLIASQNRYGGVFGILEWIHRGQWWWGGGYVMGIGAATLLFMLVGIGLYLWWPRKGRRFVDGFKLNRRLRKGPAFDMGLHRTVGAWVAIPLAVFDRHGADAPDRRGLAARPPPLARSEGGADPRRAQARRPDRDLHHRRRRAPRQCADLSVPRRP